MRDWTKTLRPASFRGVPFHVETEGLVAGRHVAVHEYVRSEEIQTEDMGRKAKRYRITAYIANDMADVQGAALVAALTSPGPGMLMLPMLGPVEVRISGDVSTNHSKDRLGYVGFDFEAVEAGASSAFPSLALGDRLAGAAAGLLGGAANSMLSGVAGTLLGGASLSMAGTVTQALGGVVGNLASSLPLPVDLGASLASKVAGAGVLASGLTSAANLGSAVGTLSGVVREIGGAANPLQAAPMMLAASRQVGALVKGL